jgi:hypothetical protein
MITHDEVHVIQTHTIKIIKLLILINILLRDYRGSSSDGRALA